MEKREQRNKIIMAQTWNELEWKDIILKVKAHQDKIVRATMAGDMKGVYNLQRELITSFEGRAVAVRGVVTNTGGKTPGVDQVTWKNPAERFEAIKELGRIVNNPHGYKASPLKRIMIPKPNSTEERPLSIPTLRDRTVQAVYKLAVDPVVETRSDLNSYGFRKGRSQHDAIAFMRTYLDKTHSPRHILEADIAKCFDKIDHEFLMKNTPICDKSVLRE
jgi:RNA-directed DNA polymerase